MTSKRPYQAECTAEIVRHFYEGVTCQGISLPCSSGKTVVVGTLPDDLHMLPGESLLFIAHRHELIDQAAEKFRTYNPDLYVEIERADERAQPEADVVVASLQSMTPKRIRKFDPDRFRIVVVDETHHAATSAQYQRIMEYFGVHRSRASLSRQKLLVGLSATWRRGDQKGYEHLFDKIVFHRSILDIMRQGIFVGEDWCPYLAPIRSNRELTDMSLDKVKVSGGDWETNDLAKAVDTPERNNFIVDTYLEKGEGMPAIAFTVNVQHSHNLAQTFCDRGIPFEAIHGEMGKGERRGYFEDFRKGAMRGLCSCDAITEGTDLPWACVGLNGKPMLSLQKYTQAFGRIGRPWPAPEERLAAHQAGTPLPWIKPYGIWIDFTDSSTRHNLIQAPTLFGLRPDFAFKGKDIEETVKIIAEAKLANPKLETGSLRSLDDLARTSVGFDGTAAPQEDVDLRKWSRYPWMKESEGQWALPVRGTNTVLRVKFEEEKSYSIWAYHLGAGSIRKRETTLRKSLEAAERLLDKKERRILQRDAPWRREPPTVPQCISLYMKDAELRKRFRNGDAFFSYAHTEHAKGSMEYSKGAIADQLNMYLIANRFHGPMNSKGKQSWVAKAVAGVKARFAKT